MLKAKGLIYGGIVGDILGVPYEFLTREEMRDAPFTGEMIAYGTHNQPLGTWSDDTSMTLCLIDAMSGDGVFNLDDLGRKFVQWDTEGLWCSGDKLFDMGMATRHAIENLKAGVPPLVSGNTGFYSNGNGSLMRIAPLHFIFHKIHDDFQRFVLVKNVSGITHGHPISVYSCYFYMLLLESIRIYQNRAYAFLHAKERFEAFLRKYPTEFQDQFSKLLSPEFLDSRIENIHGTGFVVHTLEAAAWCFVKADSFEEAMKLTINLGDDTDTTASVCGSLCGYHFGLHQIPPVYLDKILKKDKLEPLIEKFILKCT